MPLKKPATLRNWRIAMIKSTPAAPIGYVPDAEFEIKNPQKWQRLLLVVALIALFAVMLNDARAILAIEQFWPNLLIFMSITLMALGLAL
jgi:hypothetical protein